PQAAVDEQHLAGDERSLVGAEKPYRAGDVKGLPKAPEGRVLQHQLPGVVRDDLRQARMDVARRDDVRPDSAGAELAGERLREPHDPALRATLLVLPDV